MTAPLPRVLSIAGSDPSGGAGVQADLKTITMLGGYGMAAITALTVQNTQSVDYWQAVPAGLVMDQVRAVMNDIGADAIKFGMMGNPELVADMFSWLRSDYPGVPRIVDPVLVATSGDALGTGDMVAAYIDDALFDAILTPNLDEASLLAGRPVATEADMERIGMGLVRQGARAVIMKGGHLATDRLVDLVVTTEGVARFEHAKIDTPHTHGTGCTLSSALAYYVGLGLPIAQAFEKASAYVQGAIKAAPGLGQGHGPLGHNWLL